MHSFELKTVIQAAPGKVFAVITDPKFVTQWDYCTWMQNDLRTGGTFRKRDEEGRLFAGEIVACEPPFRFAYVQPMLLNTEDEDEGRFPVRLEFGLETYENQSVLTLTAAGFPSADLRDREKNSWGGYFLEKLKKTAEKI